MLPADDRGLAYGDGCFETLRVENGRAPLAAYHLERMSAGARRLGIPFDTRLWWRRLEAVIAGAPAERGVAKLILTRGSGGRGYLPPETPDPRLLTQWHPLTLPPASWRERGIELGLAATRLAEQPQLAGIKHLNRLEQVMARREAARQGWQEALMLDAAGRPLELSSMNLFLLSDGVMKTPPIATSGVAGVMRGRILQELAPALGLPVRECRLTLSGLRGADEVFACNSVVGVLPVRKLGLWTWPPGDVTRRLGEAVESLFQS